MKLAVLNPGGKDSEQPFPNFAGVVDDKIHAPVNFHAFAACTAGSFHRDAKKIGASQKNVLLLLRHDLDSSLKNLRALKSSGKTVAISWKESGAHQIANQLDRAKNITLFREICALADGALATTPDSVAFYRGAGAKQVEFIPTPYPIDDPRWDFSAPFENREGVFIGTREFSVPSRNHLAALLVARELGAPLTVFNLDGRAGKKRIESCGIANVKIIDGRRPYSEYLRLVARHRIVFQLDRSAVPGQVAGDSLLCRVPCVGGDGAIERLAFRDSCGYGRDTGELLAIAARFLNDEKFYMSSVESALAAARESISFSTIAKKLEAFFGKIAQPRS